ncbi:MAG: hypothetical protein KGP29_00270 [Proteobacteria bacterium]|nr:hypothetical protein [Pseudomonadota bacterium]
MSRGLIELSELQSPEFNEKFSKGFAKYVIFSFKDDPEALKKALITAPLRINSDNGLATSSLIKSSFSFWRSGIYNDSDTN